jgi:hypothetical protein
MSPLSPIPQGEVSGAALDAGDGASNEAQPPGGRRSRGGRPPKAEAERRRHKYLVSANDAERDALVAAAEALGLAPAVYLRQAGLDARAGAPGATLERRGDDVRYHRLSRIGVRLQALARRAAAEGRPDDEATLSALVEEVVVVRGTL